MARVFVSQGSQAMAHKLDDLLERWRLRKDQNDTDKTIGLTGTIQKITRPTEIKTYVLDSEVILKMASIETDDLRALLRELEAENNEVKAQLQLSKTWTQDEYLRIWKIQAEYIRGVYNTLSEAVKSELGKRRRANGKGPLFSPQSSQEAKSDLEAIRFMYDYVKDAKRGIDPELPNWNTMDLVQGFLRKNGFEV